MCGLYQQHVGGVAAGWHAAIVCWAILASVFASAAEPGSSATPPTGTASPVVLKLHWYPQAQFAGYLLAQDKGFFRAAGLGDVEIRWSTAGERTLDFLNQQESAFCTGWLCDALVRRSRGARIVHLAQITQKSAMLLVTRRASGIVAPADMTGQRVGLWGGDFDVLPRAFFRKFQVQPEIVPQSNSMVPFLRGAVSIASAMHYNEYHKLLEAGLRVEDLQVFPLADYGLDFPEDGLYCHERCWRDRADQCTALVRAVQQGWDYALEHEVEALDVVMAYCRRADVRTSRNHQRWMLRSMAELIRGRPDGTAAAWGELSATVYQGVAQELLKQGLLEAVPPFAEFHRPAQTQRKGV
jgi:NitT/TauT family transport system substrate-binding protein